MNPKQWLSIEFIVGMIAASYGIIYSFNPFVYAIVGGTSFMVLYRIISYLKTGKLPIMKDERTDYNYALSARNAFWMVIVVTLVMIATNSEGAASIGFVLMVSVFVFSISEIYYDMK